MASIGTDRLISEAFGAFLAVCLFLMPRSCTKAAMKGGIVTDYGCWFWIDADGLKVCKRHEQRAFCGAL